MISVTFNFSEFCISSVIDYRLLFVIYDQSDFSLPIRFCRGVVLYIVMSKLRALDN